MGRSMKWARLGADDGALPPISVISGAAAERTLTVRAVELDRHGRRTRATVSLEVPVTEREARLARLQQVMVGLVVAPLLLVLLLVRVGPIRRTLQDWLGVELTTPGLTTTILVGFAMVVVVGLIAVLIPHTAARMSGSRVEILACAEFRRALDDAHEARLLGQGSGPPPVSPNQTFAPLGLPGSPGAPDAAFGIAPSPFADPPRDSGRSRARRVAGTLAVVAAGALVAWYVERSSVRPEDVTAGMCIERPESGAEEFESTDCHDAHFGEVAGIGRYTPDQIATLLARVSDPSIPVPDRCAPVVAGYLPGERPVGIRITTYSVSDSSAGAPMTQPDVICVLSRADGSTLTAPLRTR